MKLNWFFAAIAAVSLTQVVSAGPIGPLDTFQNGTTDNWFAGGLGLGMVPANPPHVVANGGPLGGGDEFLEITGIGGSGAGSRIVAINLNQWAGNYTASGISGISMDLVNLGRTTLTIRLQFEDSMGGPPADEAVTTFGETLSTVGGWQHVVFAISPASMTTIFGNVNTLLSNTTLIRIIESAGPTEADPIVGVLGVDNIAAIAPEPATLLSVCGGLAGLIAWRRSRTRRQAAPRPQPR